MKSGLYISLALLTLAPLLVRLGVARAEEAPSGPSIAQKPTQIPSPPRVTAVGHAPYWNDPRLEKEIAFPKPPKSRQPEPPLWGVPDLKEIGDMDLLPVLLLDGQVLRGREAAAAMTTATGVPLLLEGPSSRSLVAVPSSGLPARELMDSLARVVGGTWHRDGERWVLARYDSAVPYVVFPRAERDHYRVENIRKLVSLLQPSQWEKLGRDGSLDRVELTREQKLVVGEQLRLDYFDPERMPDSAPTEEALMGNGVRLRITGRGQDARFGIECPGANGRPYFPSTPFYNPQSGQLTWGVPPPR